MYSTTEHFETRDVVCRPKAQRKRQAESIAKRFDVTSTAEFCAAGNGADQPFLRVALQFPDELLHDTVAVVHEVYAAVREKLTSDDHKQRLTVFAIADGTYGSCHSDEVTAQHYLADCIVHYGFACFSRPCQLPIFYVLPFYPVDVEQVITAVKNALSDNPDTVTIVLHPGVSDETLQQVSELDDRIVVARNTIRRVEAAAFAGGRFATVTDSCSQSERLWTVNGVSFKRVDEAAPKQVIIFVGPADAPQLFQLALIASYNSELGGFPLAQGLRIVEGKSECSNTDVAEGEAAILAQTEDVYACLPMATQMTVKRRIRQRVFNTEKIIDATAVGILVTTVNLSGGREIAENLRTLLIRSGKRAYIIYVGHLNEFKIANFADSLDVMVGISCPDSREVHFTAKDDNFMKPMVSIGEVLIALKLVDFSDPAAFTTDFTQVACLLFDAVAKQRRMLEEHVNSKTNHDKKVSDSDEENDDRKKKEGALIILNSGDSRALLIARPNNLALAKSGSTNSAVQRLQAREYCGLETRVGETPIQSEIFLGKKGIARGYDTVA